MSASKILKLKDFYRPNDNMALAPDDRRLLINGGPYVNSKIEVYNDSGELIYGPLHNKTVIAGSALVAQKLFNLDRSCLDATPTYETMLGGLYHPGNPSNYPTVDVKDASGKSVGSAPDEMQRKIIGFCVGQGGAGLDISDTFDVDYCDCIYADNIIPFRYPLTNADTVDEEVYKGRKELSLTNGDTRNAYYFKTFSNEPKLVQNYVSSTGIFADSVNAETVYTNKDLANAAQSYVELHLKITKDDLREYFITHKGLENAKLNQISLVSAWTETVKIEKLDRTGSLVAKDIEYFRDIRPFSLVNLATEIMSDPSKSISILYTLYF